MERYVFQHVPENGKHFPFYSRASNSDIPSKLKKGSNDRSLCYCLFLELKIEPEFFSVFPISISHQIYVAFSAVSLWSTPHKVYLYIRVDFVERNRRK